MTCNTATVLMTALSSCTLASVPSFHVLLSGIPFRLPYQLLHRAALRAGLSPPMGSSRQSHRDESRRMAGTYRIRFICLLGLYVVPR